MVLANQNGKLTGPDQEAAPFTVRSTPDFRNQGILVMPCMGNLYTSPYDVHRTYYTPCPRNILYARIVVCVSVGGCVKRPGRLIMVVYLPTGRKQIWRLSTG
jgi:hypothetical protein